MTDLIRTPSTGKGVLIGLWVLAVLVLLMYASVLLTVVVWAVIVSLVLYVLYLIGVRVHRYLRDVSLRGRGGQA